MYKRFLSVLSVLLVIVLSVCCVSCNVRGGNGYVPPQTVTDPSDKTEEPDSRSEQLEILKTDAHLTQDQIASKIKAEYLLENNGYKDEDEIVAIVTLPGDALIDTCLENDFAGSVADYAQTNAGKMQAQNIADAQNKLVRELKNQKLITDVEYTYSTVMNAVAVNTTYGNFQKIGKLASVQSTLLSDTFNLPKTVSTDTSAIVNVVDVYETGIFNSSSVDYDGSGTAVAILDSGFDCSHTVFEDRTDPNNLWIDPADVTKALPETNARKHTPELDLADVWYSNKIPFAYDYADKDKSVFPFDSEHGTHVAGIIGGKDSNITGVAINTQLVLMKVFPDLRSGAETEDILAALEDAVRLDVDAINMSLGTSCGFAREEDGNVINTVYDKINDSGISLIVAASNDYSAAYGGEQGNTNKVTNPDSSTVGAPSTYAGALSVASISGTKSRYIIGSDNNGNDEQVFFFTESAAINGKPNDFVKELGIQAGDSKEFEYVTVPGVGRQDNYVGLNVEGKIALVRRGDNTFEDKALQAKNAKAVACIIYNNVEGDISMSMGKSDHIPTISISKEDGTRLASRETGKMTIAFANQAGPFMSDFSSWGPLPDLQLKPEITAHGGNIRSSVPGGGYDELSGTSMACPNLCGIVVLIRQYLKENFGLEGKELAIRTNQLLMSTATIVLNEEGNPYSPRKQGAGLASLFNVVNTRAFLTVDGSDRAKIELRDDPSRTGVYEMAFNVVNTSDRAASYTLDLVGMTETVSTSDPDYVAEKSRILGGSYTSEATGDGTLSGKTVSVNAGGTLAIKVTYTLTAEDKKSIDEAFPYGMYVEGFVKLTAAAEGDIDLNIPFLAFYGDWTQAPLFDKTYYEVESQAHDGSIDEEDKLKADYMATTPYGSYYYNYIIPLGTYLYNRDEGYEAIPASEEHIALADSLGAIDGLSSVYGGLLRGAKTMQYTVTDKVTGEVMWEYLDYNAIKAHANNGSPVPYFEFLNVKSTEMGLVNNHTYEFKMQGLLDYGDGGLTSNARNTFQFDFVCDNESPVLKEATFEKEYDRTLKKDRYYLTMTVYDNHYVQAITPVRFTKWEEDDQDYSVLDRYPIPVYSEKGKDNVVRFEITDYLDDLYSDELLTSGLAFSIDDYALNSNIYLVRLPGTAGEFRFTRDGSYEGETLRSISVLEDEIIDLTQYLATSDETADEDKDYLKYMMWISGNESIARVQEGQLLGVKAGLTTITVGEMFNGKYAEIKVNVRRRTEQAAAENVAPQAEENEAQPKTVVKEAVRTQNNVENVADANIESLRFTYFDTLFAYPRAGQISEIGATGERTYVTSLPLTTSNLIPTVSFYPGEKIQLTYDLRPWYVEDKYELTYSSTNPNIATVDEKTGVVTANRKGSTTITLRVAGSNLMARLRVTVNSEFVIENRQLVAYKGIDEVVTIPDDEGILYISAYAFCLYETDREIQLPEDDYDANKIPSTNRQVKRIIVPAGVEEIQKYAFYSCTALEEVVLPDSIKVIRDYAFYGDVKLTSVNTENVFTIGVDAFRGCKSLQSIALDKAYAIAENAFRDCTSLQTADLTALRNTGKAAFRGCTALTSVVLTENTVLSEEMFAESGLTSVEIFERNKIPALCFFGCADLTSVRLHNSLVAIEEEAFAECGKLQTIVFGGNVSAIGAEAFRQKDGDPTDSALQKFVLPAGNVTIGNFCFFGNKNLKTVEFTATTRITDLGGSTFEGTGVDTFTVAAGNPYYKNSSDGKLLLSANSAEIVMAAVAADFGDYTLDSAVKKIGAGAFAGTGLTGLTLSGDTAIGDYAFLACEKLETLTLPATGKVTVGANAFRGTGLKAIVNAQNMTDIGDYAFAELKNLHDVTIGDNVKVRDGAFFSSGVEVVTVGKNAEIGAGAFQQCTSLTTVNMPAEGGVHFGSGCFGLDTKLREIDLSKTDDVIEDETFYGCTALTTANLEKVKQIGDYAFADCRRLITLTMPVVESIGEGAFARATDSGKGPVFTTLTLPATLRTIGRGAFNGCAALTAVEIPASVSELGSYAFAQCAELKSVTLPAGLTEIGEYAFMACAKLSSINLGNVKTIGMGAFYGTTALQTVDLSSAEVIGSQLGTVVLSRLVSPDFYPTAAEQVELHGAFQNSGVTGNIVANNLTFLGIASFMGANVTSFRADKLQTIAEAAFMNNANMTEFVFSPLVSEVAPLAFYGCGKLGDFAFYEGSEKKTTGEINAYARLDDGVLYTRMESGKTQLTAVPGGKVVSTLTVADGTWDIETYAGNANKNVENIVLPDSLRRIGNFAFYGYDKLIQVQFNSAVAPALESFYVQGATLTESDPGYALLQKHHDLFNEFLCYFTFGNQVGKNKPIYMVLPANETLSGYDGIVYQAYFGLVKDATRTDYVAMESALRNFIDYAEKIAAKSAITADDETLVSNAVTAYNAIRQNATNYGYTAEEWNALVGKVTDARQQIAAIKLQNARYAVRSVQEKINGLPETYSTSINATLDEIAAVLATLKQEERALLDVSKYETLAAQRVDPPADNGKKCGCNSAADGGTVLGALAVTALAAAICLIRKRKTAK